MVLVPAHLTVPEVTDSGDDWVTYAHDQMRSGYQPQDTGITPSNVSTLQLNWTANVAGGVVSSPIVTGGSVFIAGLGGAVTAFGTNDGRIQWSTQLNREIRMTPAFSGGVLFVGTHTYPGVLAALDAKTGAIRWQATVPGSDRGEPVVAGGAVYEGMAGGDPPTCFQGGIYAYNIQTGAQLWSWFVDPFAGDGGSVWGPISFDGTDLIFGTGNTCKKILGTGDAVVRLSQSGVMAWADPTSDSRSDNDVGGGVLLSGNHAFFTSKNGLYYDADAVTGNIGSKMPLGGITGYGGIGNPTTDGSVIAVSAGYLSDPTVNPTAPGGKLVGLNAAGNQLWSIPTQQPVFAYVAFTKGIAFATLDNKIVALDPQSGRILWSYTASAYFYGGPVVVPSGVYAVDTAGDVYAFDLSNGAASGDSRSRIPRARP
jgi:outer membrane protein assembly factor BamB